MIVRIFTNLVLITLPSILFCIILLELFFRIQGHLHLRCLTFILIKMIKICQIPYSW